MQPLIEKLPHRLQRIIDNTVQADEEVIVALKGQQLEALVVTGRRLLIAKTGFMTGQTFGSNVFQIPLANVAGVEVKTGFITHYFEVSAAGMANSIKGAFASGAANAREAQNCVSILDKKMARKFQEACNAIILLKDQKASTQVQSPAEKSAATEMPATHDLFTKLEKLGALRATGVISDAEFNQKKAELLARI